MKELLNKIGITQVGYYSSNNTYVIDFDGAKEYDKVFSKLDKSDLVEENDDASVINVDVSNIMYMTDDYSLNLIADFDSDTYRLVITNL